MADADEPTESLASLRWKQSAYVSRSAPSALLHPVPRASRVAVLLLCLSLLVMVVCELPFCAGNK